ncbi:recombinase family protein [Streptomyces shenzhenensis]|uniref:recombinase family protein n=1 Tax=Streptomyces shenzhenensis TaxID=943815 RepID=UPI001F271232|nr:recombinase family protein [Streptomyces shenzhenensis]
MLRVSTREQAQGYGLDLQERAGRVYVSGRPGWVLSPEMIFKDVGVSGAVIERPAMLRLEEAARQGLIDVIVVHKFDRIGRTGTAFWTWIWAMEDLGVGFASVTQDIDTTTDLGRRQLKFHALMAEAERNLIRERTQSGRQRAALEGGWVGGPPPWGYAIEKTGRRGSRLVVAEAEARVVLKAVSLIVDEKKSVSETARELTAHGYLPRSGRPWTASNVHRRLTSSALLEGKVVFRDPARKGGKATRLDDEGAPLRGCSVTIPVPRILSEERATALAKAIKETGHSSRAAAEHYPLTGRILGRCGHGYVGNYHNSQGARYYRCGGGNNGKETNCADPCLTAGDVEAAVWNEVIGFLSDPEWSGGLPENKPNVYPGDMRKQRERVTAFENRLREKEAVAARAADELAGIRDLDRTVREAALRQLAEDVRDAAAQLARGREVLAEQEKADRAAVTVSDLVLMARSGQLQGLAADRMSEVIDLLDIRVRPLGEVRKRSGVACKVTEWHVRTETPVPAEVTESVWPAVEELMATHFRCRQFARGAVDVRTQVNGILHRLRTGCLWRELPTRYGPWTLAKDRQNTWFKKGFWPVLVHHLNLLGDSAPVQREPLVPPFEVIVGITGRPSRT